MPPPLYRQIKLPHIVVRSRHGLRIGLAGQKPDTDGQGGGTRRLMP